MVIGRDESCVGMYNILVICDSMCLQHLDLNLIRLVRIFLYSNISEDH